MCSFFSHFLSFIILNLNLPFYIPENRELISKLILDLKELVSFLNDSIIKRSVFF